MKNNIGTRKFDNIAIGLELAETIAEVGLGYALLIAIMFANDMASQAALLGLGVSTIVDATKKLGKMIKWSSRTNKE